MKPFMDNNFLLDSETARILYHHYASEMPIIDYHCHVNPKEIAENKKYKNITEIWLGADHYKWRAMRSCGLPERVITGDADDYEKFEAFASALPSLIGNPLYHWSHLELKRYFGYVGIAAYALFVLYFVFLIVRRLFKNFKTAFTADNFILLIVFVLLIGIAQYSGAVLRRPNVSFYLSLVLGLLHYQTVVRPINRNDSWRGEWI
jgi:hypothetical protein